jgi:short-subunit dehydrogenase
LAPVEQVARRIVEAIAQGQPLVYTPAKWWLIMMVIRHLPRAIFNKLNI